MRMCIVLRFTGSGSLGAGVDYKGNVKLFYNWSLGFGFGAFLGGGLTGSIYPTATLDQVMGSGLNFGANVGIPGVSFGFDINVAPQKNKDGEYVGAKGGISGGIKPGSSGPGGAEIHADYSFATPFYETNIFDNTKDLFERIKETIPNLDDQSIWNFIGYLKVVQNELNQINDSSKPQVQPQKPKEATNNSATNRQPSKTTSTSKKNSKEKSKPKNTSINKKD